MELSFGEQIKIILKRKNMTIQDLALLYETHTGIKMTRQNLSQRLRRDNFPEQDMHALASMLGYQVSISLTPAVPMETATPLPAAPQPLTVPTSAPQTISPVITRQTPLPKEPAVQKVKTVDGSTVHIPDLFRKAPVQGEINPLTGEEYLSNTVRQHPDMAKYVQVYDQSTHEWIDVNEDYFWEFQAKKKEIMGSDYQEPIVI